MAVITVTELNRYLKRTIECDPLLGHITVKGELSNCKLHSSGHLYFSLKDETALVRSVMFRTNVQRLDFLPENGQKVTVSGRIGIYERDGQYQLYAEDIRRTGIGDLYLAYEQLKQKLEAEGLFDRENKKAIPPFPRTIGIVTSPTGAAIRDMIHVLSRRYRAANVYLYPVSVQGENAPTEIVRAIRYFHQSGWADVLIVGRGGGSIEDLWAFNDEHVVRAIAECRIPVISAVGHETDVTIADFAADLRAPTPSAAAELAVPSEEDLRERIAGYRLRLSHAIRNGLSGRQNHLNGISERRIYRRSSELLEQKCLELDRLSRLLQKETEQSLKRRTERFEALIAKLHTLSPLGVLSRGYSIASDASGTVIRSVGQLTEQQSLQLTLSDGTADCTVTNLNQTEERYE